MTDDKATAPTEGATPRTDAVTNFAEALKLCGKLERELATMQELYAREAHARLVEVDDLRERLAICEARAHEIVA